MNAIADDEVSTVDNNIRLNERTIEIGKMSDSLLSRRLNNLRFSQGKIDKKSKIVHGIYKTIVNVITLIKIVNNGTNNYTLLINFEIPELKNLYDGALMEAFTEISEQIEIDLSKKYEFYIDNYFGNLLSILRSCLH